MSRSTWCSSVPNRAAGRTAGPRQRFIDLDRAPSKPAGAPVASLGSSRSNSGALAALDCFRARVAPFAIARQAVVRPAVGQDLFLAQAEIAAGGQLQRRRIPPDDVVPAGLRAMQPRLHRKFRAGR